MRGLFKIKNNEKGQSMVEFAIVLPILMLLVVGIIQFGLIFNVKITLANEAREAVRYSAVGAYNEHEINNYVFSSLSKNSLLSKYSNKDATEIKVLENTIGNEKQVTVTITIKEFDLMVISKPMSLSGNATMRVEPEIIQSGSSNDDDSPNITNELESFSNLYDELYITIPSNRKKPDDWAPKDLKAWGEKNSKKMAEATWLYNKLDLDEEVLKGYNPLFDEDSWDYLEDIYEEYYENLLMINSQK